MKADMVVCPECARLVPARPQVNFFGFPKIMCPACQRTGTLPLHTARVTIYAVIGGLGILMMIVALANGALPILGIIPSLMIAAVVMDMPVRKKANEAKQRWEAAERAVKAQPK